ncbi:hypothetical protein NL676_016467 [Syzygium grande]|nr:hypothetical protein NL676_016467 [Syzygium grande]
MTCPRCAVDKPEAYERVKNVVMFRRRNTGIEVRDRVCMMKIPNVHEPFYSNYSNIVFRVRFRACFFIRVGSLRRSDRSADVIARCRRWDVGELGRSSSWGKGEGGARTLQVARVSPTLDMDF